MIRRPNVRARCFVPNLQTKTVANRKYWTMPHRCYVEQCRWCHRPLSGSYYLKWPMLCGGCGEYLIDLETDHTIALMHDGYRTDADRKIIKVERSS